jgi:NAD(P)-dependent dehydrogenase (short-subunit alcohol dehydrogenase family)
VAADSVATVCRSSGARALVVPVDVSSEESVEALFATVDREIGPPAALVNCAGIVDEKARLDQFSAARILRMLSVNVLGSFLCAREAVRRMSTAHGGSGGTIVNLSSAASRLGSPGEYIDYAASKGAVDTMTLGLAREVASEGVRVNAVRPGLVHTEIHASGGQPDRAERLAPTIPMGRGGEAREVAEAIVWLCSDEASYVTGALIDVSGGR